MLYQFRHGAGEIANRRGIVPCRPCNGSRFAEIGVFTGGIGGLVGLVFYLATLLVLLAACGAAEREELQSVSIVVTNGIVIDGTGADPITDGLVAIQGNRIVAVGQSTDFKVPEEADVIDAAGGTILPGVFNAHAHYTTASSRRDSFLLDGITSVCDLGTSLRRMQEFDREEIQSGPAARGFKAGPIVTAPGGYPGPIHGSHLSYEIQGVDEAENAVRDLHTRGADFIKVALEPGFDDDTLPMITIEELRSVVATAHDNDLLVRAHVNKSDLLDMALEAGVDVIEHVPMPSDSCENLEAMLDDDGKYRIPSRLEAQMLRMIEQGVVLVPTLDALTNDIFLLNYVKSEPEHFTQAVLTVVRFFHDSGGIIAVGNDYGFPGVHPGMPLHEMELLQAAGLSPLEVIEAGTKHAAYVCGQGDELGTLEKGKLADLIVVDGNTLEDINAMDSVLYVVKDGELVLSPSRAPSDTQNGLTLIALHSAG
jgi:imidazolonepropionase-like amidohydrolase